MLTACLAAAAMCSADTDPPRPAPPRWTMPAWLEKARDAVAAPFRKRSAGPSDAVLKLRCQDAVFVDRGLRGSGLDIEVANAVATLRGTVPTAEDARRAERLARSVRELRGVRNELRPANPFDAAQLPAGNELAGESLPAPPPRVVPASPDLSKRATLEPVPAVRLSKPRRLGPAAIAASSQAPPPGLFGAQVPWQREAGAIVGRPISVLVSPDLPRVTEYTIRRAAAPPISELLPAASSASAFVETAPRKRPGLVKPGAETTARAAGVPPPPAPMPGFIEPPRDEIEAALRDEPAAARLLYRRDGAEVILFGAAPDAAALFAVMERLGTVPGVGTISVDRPNLKLERP